MRKKFLLLLALVFLLAGVIFVLPAVRDHVPDQTKERIAKEQNEDVLSAWLKLAARADSIEEFQSKM